MRVWCLFRANAGVFTGNCMDKGILRNVAINLFGLVLPTFVSLVTVPSYIRLLGVDRYGVIALVWTLIGYFSVLDLGMSMAAQNHISKARASGDGEACERVFWSAFWLNLTTGAIGGLLIYSGGALYTAYFTHVTPELRHEVYFALPWLAIAIPVANVSWVFAGAINGAERFGVYNANQTLGTFLFQLLPLGAAWVIAPNLQTVIAAAVFARVAAALLLGHSALRVLGIRTLRGPRFDTAKALFNFGSWMLIASVTTMVGDSLDRMMLGAGLGARFVTYYTVPQNLVKRLNLVPVALERTLFPRLSASHREHADVLATQSLQFLNALFTPVAIGAIVVLGPFLNVWVGPLIAGPGAPVGRVLIVAVWLVGQASVTRVLIQAQNNPAATARLGLVELPLFAGLLWFGIHRFGLPGAAGAVLCRAMFDYLVLLHLSHIRARTILVDMFAHLSFLAAALAIAWYVPQALYAIGAGVVLALANVAWSVATTATLRGYVRSLLFRLNSRKSA